MLMRSTDPFRDFDRLAQQLLGAGTTSRPAVMPMDAWRQGDTFVVEFDLPGVRPETLDIDVERNVLTVKAERTRPNGDWEMLASERPTGLFSRQLVLGDNVDLEQVQADYDAGVLRLTIPVAEKAKPRKIEVAMSSLEIPRNPLWTRGSEAGGLSVVGAWLVVCPARTRSRSTGSMGCWTSSRRSVRSSGRPVSGRSSCCGSRG